MRLPLAAQHKSKSPEAKQGCGRWLRNGKGEVVEVTGRKSVPGLHAEIKIPITCVASSEVLPLCATGGIEPGEPTTIVVSSGECIVCDAIEVECQWTRLGHIE